MKGTMLTVDQAREAAAWHRRKLLGDTPAGSESVAMQRAAVALNAYADGIDAAAVEREAIRSRVNAAVAAGRHFAIDGEQLLLVRQVIDLIGGGDGR